MKAIYTMPKIYTGTGQSKEWYIWFRYNKKLFKKREDINRIKNLKERLLEAEAVRDYYYQKLKSGWNPLVPALESIEGADLTFYQALEFAMNKKKPQLSNKTYRDYLCTVRFAKTAVSALNVGSLQIKDTKRVHVKTILETMQKQRKWSNNAYNKALNHIHLILSELIQWDIIDKNPADDIKRLAVLETKSNIPPTFEQEIVIKKHLKEFHPEFYFFVFMIWETGIRPVELTRLKLNMINLNKREIVLPAEITKTGSERTVFITDQILDFLLPILNKVSNNDYYLFGSHRIPGRGNEGKHKDFIPGPTKMNRDTATKRWHKIVKVGLGINANLYSMKKAGANAKILSGMSVRTIKEIFGHTSEMTTEIYITNLKEVSRQEIMEKSPIF